MVVVLLPDEVALLVVLLLVVLSTLPERFVVPLALLVEVPPLTALPPDELLAPGL